MLEDIFIATSIFSAFMSGIIILTAIMFPVMRKKLFMHMIVVISACDFCAAICSAFGFPLNNNPLCQIQSIGTLFFFKASWIWTTLLCYQLYSVCVNGRFALTKWQLHFFSWPVVIFLTFIPLTTNSFGRENDDDPVGWCGLTGSLNDGGIWILITFNLLLFVCVVIMTYFLIFILWRYRSMNTKETHLAVHMIIDSLKWYPFALIVAWLPTMVVSTIFNFAGTQAISDPNLLLTLLNAFTIVSVQSGTLTSVIFLVRSNEAQFRWKLLISSNLCCCAIFSAKMKRTDLPNFQNYNNQHDVTEISLFRPDFEGEEAFQLQTVPEERSAGGSINTSLLESSDGWRDFGNIFGPSMSSRHVDADDFSCVDGPLGSQRPSRTSRQSLGLSTINSTGTKNTNTTSNESSVLC